MYVYYFSSQNIQILIIEFPKALPLYKENPWFVLGYRIGSLPLCMESTITKDDSDDCHFSLTQVTFFYLFKNAFVHIIKMSEKKYFFWHSIKHYNWKLSLLNQEFANECKREYIRSKSICLVTPFCVCQLFIHKL